MTVEFDKEYLRYLYEKGKSKGKKHYFQPEVIVRFVKCVEIMIDVPDINALMLYNSLRYERLKGDKQGISSIRVTKQYRIEFTERTVEGEEIVTICNILELSNHYE